MLNNYDSLSDTNPFWFISSELLTAVYRAEIKAVVQLLSSHPDLPKGLDIPNPPIRQRALCFELLAHRSIIEVVDETIAERYEKPLTFDAEESRAVSMSANLVTSDAPAWVLEMNEVAGRLPTHIYAALPEMLQNRVLHVIDPEKKEAVFRLAAETFGTLAQVQSLIARVFDQQLQRLTERWPVTTLQVDSKSELDQSRGLSAAPRIVRRKPVRTRDRLRVVRDELICEIDDVSQTMTEFIRLMDERDVRPLPTWDWPGSWAQAYKDAHLRKLIQQDKSRAIQRVRRKK